MEISATTPVQVISNVNAKAFTNTADSNNRTTTNIASNLSSENNVSSQVQANQTSIISDILSPEDIEEIDRRYNEGKVEIKNTVQKDPTIFTIFKLSDGKVYTRVRDLSTGEVKYFPSLDDYYYNDDELIANGKGILYDSNE